MPSGLPFNANSLGTLPTSHVSVASSYYRVHANSTEAVLSLDDPVGELNNVRCRPRAAEVGAWLGRIQWKG